MTGFLQKISMDERNIHQWSGVGLLYLPHLQPKMSSQNDSSGGWGTNRELVSGRIRSLQLSEEIAAEGENTPFHSCWNQHCIWKLSRRPLCISIGHCEMLMYELSQRPIPQSMDRCSWSGKLNENLMTFLSSPLLRLSNSKLGYCITVSGI